MRRAVFRAVERMRDVTSVKSAPRTPVCLVVVTIKAALMVNCASRARALEGIAAIMAIAVLASVA